MKPSPRLRRVLEVLRLRRFLRKYRTCRDARLREIHKARRALEAARDYGLKISS